MNTDLRISGALLGWGETGLSVPIRFLGSALHMSRVAPSVGHVPVIPVCFGDYPKALENPISVSQINWGGDLEAGRGLFYPFGLTVGILPGAKENI